MTDAQLPAHPDTTFGPDDLVDEFLRRIVESDPELGTIFRAITVALPVNDPAPEPLTAPGVGPTEEGETLTEEWAYEQAIDDVVGMRDLDGDTLAAHYGEVMCPTHGREAGVTVVVNDAAFLFYRADAMESFAKWLLTRVEKMRNAAE